MEVREITDKNIWGNFLQDHKEKTFYQSWNWGEFHEAMGEKIWRLGVYNEEKLIAVATTVRVRAKRGVFLAVEHGPVTKEPMGRILQVFLASLKEIGKMEKAVCIRISPIQERNKSNSTDFKNAGFREAPMYAAAESSWKLDITRSEEELFAAMRKTTRYLIRQAEKNEDIEIVASVKKEDARVFTELVVEVGKRQKFVPFSKKYIETEFDVFAKEDKAVLFMGKYKGETVATALVVFWGNIAFYHQAASLDTYAKLSIPYLLQWEAIKEAKKRGCEIYDFWGYVDPKKNPKHPWAGPTLFKMGFGGNAYEYIKTQDYPLSWKYWGTALFESIRKKRRHL